MCINSHVHTSPAAYPRSVKYLYFLVIFTFKTFHRCCKLKKLSNKKKYPIISKNPFESKCRYPWTVKIYAHTEWNLDLNVWTEYPCQIIRLNSSSTYNDNRLLEISVSTAVDKQLVSGSDILEQVIFCIYSIFSNQFVQGNNIISCK